MGFLLFAYLVGCVASSLGFAWLKARRDGELRLSPADGLNALAWPVAVPALATWGVLRARRNAEPPLRGWRCDELDAGKGLHDGGGRCRMRARLRKRPLCPHHKVEMSLDES